MIKPVRKAVRTFLIEDDKVLAIKFTTNDNKLGYYDIPGGKIEQNETAEEAAIREFKEEAGMIIKNPKYAGNLVIEYPERIFDFDIFITNEYKGTPKETEENVAEWISIEKLLQKDKIFTEVLLLMKEYRKELQNRTNFKYRFIASDNQKLISETKE